jgi:ribose 1,5-bisphosphokinase
MIFAVVGPSGAGKDTLLAGAVAASPGLHWARRVVTRPAQEGGEPFEGVDAQAFARRLAAGEFALHWQAHGLRYGISHDELRGDRVVFNGSRQAIGAAITALPGLRVVRITAPSRVLAERLAARGRESREEIEARLARASYDLPEGVEVIDVVNDATPEIGVGRLLAALQPLRA